MEDCFGCGKIVQRHPMDDAMDCFCQRCPRCNDAIFDGTAVGSLCEDCYAYDNPDVVWPDGDYMEVGP